jgi:hypothetical protein
MGKNNPRALRAQAVENAHNNRREIQMFSGGLMQLFWYMLAFYFLFMLIWMFIATFADIFKSQELSGWGKAGWILFIFIVPLIGILAYVLTRKPSLRG